MLLYPGILTFGAFILGTIFGSFLNVIIYRTGSGMGYHGRSKCLSCGKKLSALMLIPLFSFMFQRGRCWHCRGKISWQYPLVEATLGLLFVLVIMVTKFDPFQSNLHQTAFFIIDASVWSVLLGILVYDLKHKIIPDRFVIIFALLAVFKLLLELKWGLVTPTFISIFGMYVTPWMNLFAGPLLALPFALLWFFSGGRAMGFGDAKLAWGIGWFLGITGGISAIVFAFWTAFFPSLLLLFLPSKKFTMKSEIPFAPFLVLGTCIVYAFGIDIFTWSIVL